MFSLSQLINKDVISIYDCEKIGKVSGILVNKNLKCTYIIITHENINKVIQPKDILKYSNDSLLIRNKSCVNLVDNLELSILGQSKMLGVSVYDVDGNYIGKISDVNFLNYFKLFTITIDEKTFDIRKIFNISDSLCLIKNNNLKTKLSNYKPKGIPNIKQNDQEIKVEVLNNINDNPTKMEQINLHENNQSYSKSNTKGNFDYSILIGRKLKRNITSQNGEILLRVNSYIVKENIKTIRTFGKLYEVLKYSE